MIDPAVPKDTQSSGADHSTASFTTLADLASARVGGRALAANDEFFAPRSNLVKPEPRDLHARQVHDARQVDGRLGDRAGAATPGHDWCVVALGMRGVVRGVNVDTSFFTGNFPSHCSIDAIDATPKLAAVFVARRAVDVHPG